MSSPILSRLKYEILAFVANVVFRGKFRFIFENLKCNLFFFISRMLNRSFRYKTNPMRQKGNRGISAQSRPRAGSGQGADSGDRFLHRHRLVHSRQEKHEDVCFVSIMVY